MFIRDYGLGPYSFDSCALAPTRAEIGARTVAQMDWLAALPKDAPAQGERVLLAMHVPPRLDGYSGKPVSIMDRFPGFQNSP